MKKISTTTWIILAGIFLYTATLWQRPLFIFEFTDWEILKETALKGGLSPLAGRIELFMLKNADGSPFCFRIFTAALTLLAAFVLFLSGLKSIPSNASKAGAMIFLLTPSVFLCSTSVSASLQQGALLTAALYCLFAFTESTLPKNALLWGIGTALLLTGTNLLYCSPLLYLTPLAAAILYLLCRKSWSVKRFGMALLPFIPGAFFLAPANFSGIFHLPCSGELKTLAAFMAAGTFPWIVFAPLLLKNFSLRLKFLMQEPFTLFSLLVFIICLAGAFFAAGTSSLALAAAALAGGAVLWGVLIETEYLENGFALFDRVLWILAILFFLIALALGGYAALTLYTKMLPPGWKLFTAKDAWALTALVPVVAGVWFIAGAGEKMNKERKFLSFCAGTGFILLAFHGLVPLKTVENNAPVKFFKQAVEPRLTSSAEIYCDGQLCSPAAAVFKGRTLKELSGKKIQVSDHSRALLIFGNGFAGFPTERKNLPPPVFLLNPAE